MAFANYAAYLASAILGPTQKQPFAKITTPGNMSGGSASWFSWWLGTGLPAAGSIPGAAATCNSATVGALGQTDAAVEQRIWLDAMTVSSANGLHAQGAIMFYDRLCHMGGLDGTGIIGQSVSTPAVPRYTPSTDRLCAAVEIYTAIGVTPQPLTVSYTNDAGTPGQTSSAIMFGGSNTRQSPSVFIPISLASGDVGFSSVETLSLGGSTGTVGNFGVTIYKPLLIVPFHTFTEDQHKFEAVQRLGALMPLVLPGACIAACILANAPSGAISLTHCGQLNFFED